MPDKVTDTTEKQATLLKRALYFLDQKQIVEAEALLSQVLGRSPTDPEALQLMGVLRRMQGFLPEAEDYYRRSLAVNPDQPHVHHNLGNVLKAQGRIDEAIAEQREAIRQKPNYVEAHLNLAIALSAMGDHVLAEKSCREALRLQPNYLFAKQTLSAELNELGRPKEAENILRQSLALGVRDARQVAAFEHNLGVSLKMQHRYGEALYFFSSARSKVPDMPFLDYNHANTLQHLGQFDEAVECYRRTLAGNPLHMPAHQDLNNLLYRMGRDAEFLKSYDDAASLFPDVPALEIAKANFLFLKGDLHLARLAFERAARLSNDSITPHDGLGMILARMNEFDAAVSHHEIALGMEPQNTSAWRNFAETLLRAGDASRACEAAERAIAIEPFHQGAIAIWGLALRILDDPRERSINDTNNLVRVYELRIPDRFTDAGAFNRSLNAELDKLHRDKRECIDQTLRAGTQTQDNLFGAGHMLVEQLRNSIDMAVTDYIGQLREDDKSPLAERRRAQFKYAASWSSRLRDSGYHTNHVHPKGWISSAYYVTLPDAVDKPDANEGWIKFGEPNFDCGIKNPVRRMVQPRIGSLVLFPSYMWHGTVPFRSQQERTTIAFDVIPDPE